MRGFQRGPIAFAVVSVLWLGITASVGAQATTGPVVASSASNAFAWLVPRPAPSNWKELSLADGTALSYPSDFSPIHGDPGTVSVAVIEHGSYLAYLNATPQQGDSSYSAGPGSESTTSSTTTRSPYTRTHRSRAGHSARDMDHASLTTT